MEEDLTKIMVYVATCTKCDGAVKTAVQKHITLAAGKEFGKLIALGCNVYTINVVVARAVKWCEEPCEGMWGKNKKNEQKTS